MASLALAPSCETYDRPGRPDDSKRTADHASAAASEPKTPASQARRLKIDHKAVASEGEKVYNTMCVACHGPAGVGKVGIGPRLASETFLEAASDEMLVKTVTLGRAGTTMPPWGASLSEREIHAIVGYLRGLVPHELAVLDESPLKGDTTAGAATYQAICGRCHGKAGAGYQESSSGTGIGRSAFLDTVSNGYMRHLVKHGKSNTQMRPFDSKAPTAVANLSDTEIDNVITYLRSRAW